MSWAGWWWVGVVPFVLLVLGWTRAAAQPAAQPARSTHARAQADRDLLLRLDRVALFVPAGAVRPGAVVGLGVGGVPGGSGVLVTAAGGLRGTVVGLIVPSPEDWAVIGAEGGTPALIERASGARRACVTAGAWVACSVDRPGAFVLGGTDEPPPDDPLLMAAVSRLSSPSGGGTRPALVFVVAIAVAVGAGAAVALLVGQRRQTDAVE